MHFRDTQTSDGTNPFYPKSHSAIMINASGTFEFSDRQGVTFDVIVASGNLPVIVPISVMSYNGSTTNVVFLT